MADPPSVDAACVGVDAVFYLVHAMDGPDFVERDRRAAAALAAAASDVRRVVYLGGLQPAGPRNSAHLASRREVGEILLAGRAPAAVLQAGIVVGAGSASFRMIRDLAVSGPVLMLPTARGTTRSPSASTTCSTTSPPAWPSRPRSTASSTWAARTC